MLKARKELFLELCILCVLAGDIGVWPREVTSRAAGGSPGGAFSFSSGAPTPHAAMMAETWSVSWPAAAFHHEIYFLLFPSSIGPTSPFVRSF